MERSAEYMCMTRVLSKMELTRSREASESYKMSREAPIGSPAKLHPERELGGEL